MIVAIVNNGIIEQTGDLAVLFPNTSFPASGPSAEWMAENNLVPVTYFKPYESATHKLVPSDPYLEDGSVYAVTVEPLTDEEIAARDDAQWAKVRSERNAKLAACDWTQLGDAPVDAAPWVVYRQDLRDITTQENPFNITWPQEPE